MIWSNLWAYPWAPPHAQYPTPWPKYVPGVPTATAAGSLSHAIESDHILSEPASVEVGELARLFSYDFYDRIHVTPTVIDFGNLVGVQSRTLSIWNAFYRGRTLEYMKVTDAEGITLEVGPQAPTHFLPLSSKVWNVVGTQFGPAVINGDINILFDGDGSTFYVVQLLGQRVVAWPWEANWSTPILERIEWLSDVIESYDASEQRRSLRTNPRRSLEFGILEKGAARRNFESLLWSWGSKVWAIPLWMDIQRTTQDVNPFDWTIHLDTRYRDFQAGAFVILWGDDGSTEICEVFAKSDSYIDLLRPVVGTWPKGTRIYPARAARLQSAPQINRHTGDVIEGRMVFDFSDPHTWTADPGLATYRGYPVLTTMPNWTELPQFAFDRKVFRFDVNTGRQFFDEITPSPTIRHTARYSFFNRAKADDWRKMLHYLKGRFKSVWVRSHASDIKVIAQTLSASLVLNVENIGYTKYLSQEVGRRDIRIQLNDGSVFYRRITSSEEVSSTSETLTLDANLGVDISPSNVAVVSFITLARLDSDAVEISWLTDTVSECSVTYKSFTNNA